MAIVAFALTPLRAQEDVIVTASSPIEAKLAALDAQTPAVDPRRFVPYAQLLGDLDRACKETRAQIGALVTRTVTGLWKKDINVTHLKFLQTMKEMVPEGVPSPGTSCADLAARVASTIARP